MEWSAFKWLFMMRCCCCLVGWWSLSFLTIRLPPVSQTYTDRPGRRRSEDKNSASSLQEIDWLCVYVTPNRANNKSASGWKRHEITVTVPAAYKPCPCFLAPSNPLCSVLLMSSNLCLLLGLISYRTSTHFTYNTYIDIYIITLDTVFLHFSFDTNSLMVR